MSEHLTYTYHNKATVTKLAEDMVKAEIEKWEIEANGIVQWNSNDGKTYTEAHVEYRVAVSIANSKYQSAKAKYEAAFVQWESEGFL